MDAEVISRFTISQVKEKTFSKDEKRDIEKPCTSSAVSKQTMNIDTDENDVDDEEIDDESDDEDTQ